MLFLFMDYQSGITRIQGHDCKGRMDTKERLVKNLILAVTIAPRYWPLFVRFICNSRSIFSPDILNRGTLGKSVSITEGPWVGGKIQTATGRGFQSWAFEGIRGQEEKNEQRL